MSRRSQETGFSLVEVLVASALLAGVMATLAPAIFSSVKASSRVVLSAAQAETLRTGRDAFERVVSGAMWLPKEWAEEKFDGTVQDMQFLTTAGPDRNLAMAELTATGGFENRRLVLTLRPIDGANWPIVEVDILDGLTDARFAYWGTETNSASPTWRDEWSSLRPPQLIAVEVRRGDAKQSTPLRLEFATFADAPILCDFDPVSRSCRS